MLVQWREGVFVLALLQVQVVAVERECSTLEEFDGIVEGRFDDFEERLDIDCRTFLILHSVEL